MDTALGWVHGHGNGERMLGHTVIPTVGWKVLRFRECGMGVPRPELGWSIPVLSNTQQYFFKPRSPTKPKTPTTFPLACELLRTGGEGQLLFASKPNPKCWGPKGWGRFEISASPLFPLKHPRISPELKFLPHPLVVGVFFLIIKHLRSPRCNSSHT